MEGSRYSQAAGAAGASSFGGGHARNLTNWVDGFYSYTKDLPSPDLFRKWGAISIIAGALERKVWVRSYGMRLFPNLYVVMVAPPGVGKTVITSQIRRLWEELDDHHIASSSITKAAMIDELSKAERNIVRPGENPSVVTFHSLKICSNELAVLIPGYDNEFMNTMTDIYDGHGYSERRRTKEIHLEMPAAQFNFVAATTPGYLQNMLPEGAWDQGFLSRTMLVYSGQQQLRSLFKTTTQDTTLWDKLVEDLRMIGALYGEMKFNEEAALAIDEWHMAGGPPTPDHPRLVNYNTRRSTHLIKLCMVACAASGSSPIITIDHFTEALDWLVEYEMFIPDIFKSMGAGGDIRVIEDTYYHLYQLYTREKKAIALSRIVAFVQERTPAHNVERIIENMKRADFVIEQYVEGSTILGLIPNARK